MSTEYYLSRRQVLGRVVGGALLVLGGTGDLLNNAIKVGDYINDLEKYKKNAGHNKVAEKTLDEKVKKLPSGLRGLADLNLNKEESSSQGKTLHSDPDAIQKPNETNDPQAGYKKIDEITFDEKAKRLPSGYRFFGDLGGMAVGFGVVFDALLRKSPWSED